MQNRIQKLLFETTGLNEYQIGHKNELITLINKMVLQAKTAADPQGLDKKLNDFLEFYRYYEKGIPFEDVIVYNEFRNKLLKLAKDHQIALK